MTLNKKAALAALNKFALAGPALVKALREAGYTTREDARVLVLEWAAKKLDCPLVKSSHHLSKTAYILDASSPNYAAARQAVGRMMDVLQGEKRVSNKKEAAEPVTVSRAQRAAAMTFLASFEGKTLADQIKAAKAVLTVLG